MAFGTLKADTLTHSTAGSLATNYVVNGSAKAWSNVTSASVLQDSLNVSSVTDNSGGNYDLNFTNSFANTTYSHVGSDGNFGNANTSPHTLTTSSADVFTFNGDSSSNTDASFATVEMGDLA
tara:strand:- start:50 stop:415 length:366 start_codon:yes stop_codon:yes gene_type:complete